MSPIERALRGILDAGKALIEIKSKEQGKQPPETRAAFDKPDKIHHNPDIPPLASQFGVCNKPTTPPTCPCQNRPKDGPERFKLWIDICLAPLTVALFIVIYFQMKANVEQAQAAEKQFGEMVRQNRMDERAWVVPVKFTLSNGTYTVEFKNTGRTPAIGVDGEVRSTSDMNDISNANWKPNPGGPYTGMLGPNVSGFASAMRVSNNYFYGRIWYNDIFTNLHWTDFTVFHGQGDGDNFYTTKFGNDIGDYRPEKTN